MYRAQVFIGPLTSRRGLYDNHFYREISLRASLGSV